MLRLGLPLLLLVAVRELLPFVHRLQYDLAQVVVDVRRRILAVVPVLVVERVRAFLLRLGIPTRIDDIRKPKLVGVLVDTPERTVDVDIVDRRVAVRLLERVELCRRNLELRREDRVVPEQQRVVDVVLVLPPGY